jgi:hypothetical protein
MRWVVIAMVAGCAEPTGLGEASATAYPDASSATVIVANATDGIIAWRVWSIEIGDSPPGTDCKNRRDPLVSFDVLTQLSSAPRNVIPLTLDVPPFLFPAVYARYSNGFAIDGEMVIELASSTGLFGSFRGQANLDGTVVTLEAAFEAPTCGI